MMFNLIWFIVMSFLFFILMRSIFTEKYFLLSIPLLVSGPLFLFGFELAENNDFKLKEVLKKARVKIYRSILVFILAIAVYIILVYDFLFVLNKIGENKLLLIFPVLILYLIIMFNMYQINLWGLLIKKPNLNFMKYLKKAFKLTKDNFLFTLIWSLIIFIFAILLIFTRIGAFIFLNSFFSILVINGTEYMLNKTEGDKE